MVQPMARIFIFHDLGRREMREATVLFGVGGPAIGAIHHQYRAGDGLPNGQQILTRHIEDCPDIEVIVELPAPASIFVAADTMHREMPRLFVG